MNTSFLLDVHHPAELLAAPSNAAHHARMLARVHDEIDYGWVVVDADARVLCANRLGLRELQGKGPLTMAQGCLHAHTHADRQRLAQVLADARRGLRRMFTAGQSGVSVPVPVSVMPLPDEADGEPLVLLFFGKQNTSESLTVDFYARDHHLTGAELTVLKLLCDGTAPGQIARSLDVAVCTVRSHICNIRLKTQTKSIRDLLNRVAALPPVTMAMKGALVQ